MEITGSTRKILNTFSAEESSIKVQLPSGKGHTDVPQAELEHVIPLKEEIPKFADVNERDPENVSIDELKNRLRRSVESITIYENDISRLVTKIDQERNKISGLIDRL